MCKPCASDKAKAWQQANKVRAAVAQAASRANRLHRVPRWYDQQQVLEIFEFAAEFRAAGFEVDIDHIIPLHGKVASGLHWHGNLRVCLTYANREKHNNLSTFHEPLATPEHKFV